MKHLILLCLAALLFMTSCKKEKKVAEVKYEVTLTNSPTWHGVFLDKDGQAIGITSAPNNWQYTFANDNNLPVVTLLVYVDGTSPGADANMKIYVNGAVVAQSKASIYPQVQYQFP